MVHDILFDKKTVLLVEDDIAVLQRVESQLYALDVGNVVSVTNLKDAEAALADQQINMALLDVNLQFGETTVDLGWSLTASQIPVVFFSGFNFEDMARATFGHELLEKPISLPRLKAAMLRAILRAPYLATNVVPKKMAGQMARQSG